MSIEEYDWREVAPRGLPLWGSRCVQFSSPEAAHLLVWPKRSAASGEENGFIRDWNERLVKTDCMSMWFVLARVCNGEVVSILRAFICFWLLSVETFKILFYIFTFIMFLSRSSIQMDRKYRPRIMSLRCWVRLRRHLLWHRKDDYR